MDRKYTANLHFVRENNARKAESLSKWAKEHHFEQDYSMAKRISIIPSKNEKCPAERQFQQGTQTKNTFI